MDFVAGNSNKLQKLRLEGKIWSPQCVHTWANGTGDTKCLKSSNYLTGKIILVACEKWSMNSLYQWTSDG